MSKLSSILIVFSMFYGSCAHNQDQLSKPKSLILLIGDGMGPGQIALLQQYINHSRTAKANKTKFAFERLNQKTLGISATDPYDKIVVDSACSATQLAIGAPSRSEMIGLDINGDKALTILEKAKRKGLSTGLVSDTRLTHATPASFAAHVSNRWFEDEIASGMIETAPDVLLSGGANRFYPKSFTKKVSKNFKVKSRRADERNLIQEARDNNYQVIHSRSELENIKKGKKLLGLFTNHSYPDALWLHNNKNSKKRKIPTLLEMSKVAVKKLSQNEKGFFLMIEGGQIDWAAHRNDAGTMLHEMLSFNETLNWVIDWVKDHPETLIVVTADHETGGFGLGYNVHNLPKGKKLSGEMFKDRIFRPFLNYGRYSTLDQLYEQKISYADLLNNYQKLPKKKQTIPKLGAMIKSATGINLSQLDIKEIFTETKNVYKADWHRTLNIDTLPEMHGKQAFYFTPGDVRTALIGRATSPMQNVVWGTGGHTATPVNVFSLGPKDESFSGYLNHPELGKKLQQVLEL